MLEKIFHLKEKKTSIRNEIQGGIVTFTAMSYIIFVQPALLKNAGMDPGAVTAAKHVCQPLLRRSLWVFTPIIP